jgi:hypothetical protein
VERTPDHLSQEFEEIALNSGSPSQSKIPAQHLSEADFGVGTVSRLSSAGCDACSATRGGVLMSDEWNADGRGSEGGTDLIPVLSQVQVSLVLS